MRLILCLFLTVLAGCSNDNSDPTTTKTDFINTIFNSGIDEGPFAMHYSLRTVLLSREVISLFGHTDVYTHLPHSWGSYEGENLLQD
jgi:hypothetical protein